MAVGSAATEALLTAEGGDISTYCIRQYLLPMAVAEQSAEGHILLEHWKVIIHQSLVLLAKDSILITTSVDLLLLDLFPVELITVSDIGCRP